MKGLVAVVALISYTVLLSTSGFAGMPLTTDDAYTVEKGKFQLEIGFDYARQDNHDKEFGPSVTLTYGLLERMDVAVGTGYLFIDPTEGKNENGLGDTEVKVKYHLIDQKDWIPHFAVSGTLKIPTASESKGLGSGKTDFNINTIFTWDLSERWQLYSNLGYTFIGEHHVENDFNYSVAAQFALSEKWALVGEIFGVNNFNGHKSDDPISGLVGAQYQLSDHFVLDAGVEIGMNKAAPDYRLTAGLTIFF
jgi:hypothetical protein